MTTASPPPAKQPPTAGQQEAPVALSEDRVNAVGWFFIQSYYDFFVNTLDNIHKIYHAQASVTHDSFPSEDGKQPVQKAKGVEAIKSRFRSDENLKKTNRIVITNASFQTCLNKNILIVVFGEWSQGDSNYHQFTQTFLLTPGAKENTFDVANDILKFVDSNGFQEQNEVSESMASPVTESVDSTATTTISEDAKETSDVDKLADTSLSTVPSTSEESTELTAIEDAPSKDESKKSTDDVQVEANSETAKEVEKSESDEIPQEEAKNDLKMEVKEEATKEEQEPEKSNERVNNDGEKVKSSTTPNQPMSWADLASQAPVKPKVVAPVTKPTPVKKASPAAPSSTNGKYKKEDWFPIYIRGIKELDEKNLREHLSTNFGDIKFFRVNHNIALCDFFSEEAQKKALEAKETSLNGIKFQLEPRESKTGNNYHSPTGKKFQGKEFRKDISDAKRNRPDNKKINGAKKLKNEGK